jgi:uncharacterized protein YjiK
MRVLQKFNIFSFFLVLIFAYCNPEKTFQSPTGYNFNQPEKIKLPHALDEISGISFLKGNDDTVYAIEDEAGKLYRYSLSTGTVLKSKFYSKADYEDLTIFKDSLFVVLRSNGELYTFPIAESRKEAITNVLVYKDLLPAGEYEGLFAKDNKWYVLCKNCKGDNDHKEVTVYEIQPANGNVITKLSPIKINYAKIRKSANIQKENFHPSCLAFHPITREWYIISSVNDQLLILDEKWNAKEIYEINSTIFKQTEGIAFNKKGDLFVSNEAAGTTANILRFNYHAVVKK